MNIKLNIKLNMNQQCIFAARKANCMPGCISKNDDMIISLSSAIVRPQLRCYIHFWPLQNKKNIDNLESV